MNAIFQSFFTSFFIGFRRICLHAKVRNLVFIICSLLVGIDCVTDKLKATFPWRKNLKTGTPQNTENHMLRLWNFNILWGRAHPDPTPPSHPRKGGLMVPCWYTAAYSIQTYRLLQLSLKPLGFLQFCGPHFHWKLFWKKTLLYKPDTFSKKSSVVWQ